MIQLKVAWRWWEGGGLGRSWVRSANADGLAEGHGGGGGGRVSGRGVWVNCGGCLLTRKR